MEPYYHLIRVYFAEKEYQHAIVTANEGLAYGPDTTLLHEKAKALYLLKDYKTSIHTLNQIPNLKTHPEAHRLYNEINQLTNYAYYPHFSGGIIASPIIADNPGQTWWYNSAYINRNTEHGHFGVFVNHARRFNQDALQYGIMAHPKLANRMYFDLGYAFSNEPRLFPNQMYYGEAYLHLLPSLAISGGGMHRKISQTFLNSYTASVEKYIGNFHLSLRFRDFEPANGPSSMLYFFHIRRYSDTDPRRYVGLLVATGTSPDLTDLSTVNFFKIDNTIVMLTAQSPLSNTTALYYGLGYERQIFPNRFIRDLLYFQLGLKFRAV